MSATTVADVLAWMALDSRGRPTVACRVVLTGGATGTAAVPSGASAGSHEAVELRDRDERFEGYGVQRALANLRSVGRPAVLGVEASDVDAALAALDPSEGHRELGANSLLPISIAAAIAAAAAGGRSLARAAAGPGPLLLPMPMVNMISGGAHAGGIVDFQDYLVIPNGAGSFEQAIEWSAAVRSATTRLAMERAPSAVLVADEGGVAIPFGSNREPLDLLMRAIESAGLEPGRQVSFALDVAANELFEAGEYRLTSEKRSVAAGELATELSQWCRDYPIVSIEDPAAEDDTAGWGAATSLLGDRIELVGDDLFVTNPGRLAQGLRDGIANSVLVKVNQNGLLSGAHEVLTAARAAGYGTVVSARSGETEDSWLADLAVGWRAGQIKVGSTHRSERTAKWNRLLELEATEQTEFSGPWPQHEGRARRPGRNSS